MRLLASFDMFKNARETTCAQVTSRAGGFHVYLYTTDGFHEESIDESDFADVNDAMKFAYAFGGDPRMLFIETATETLCDWSR